MPCNASYARFIFGKFFISTIILYALLFAQKLYSCKKWVLHENNKLRRKAKGKKTKGGSFSSEDEDFSLKEDVSKKGKKGRNNHDKPSYNSMSFNYDNMSSTTAYTSVPIGNAPYFDGTCYNQWKYCMKNYLYSISLEVWQVVCNGVELSDEDEQLTVDQLQNIHRNAQAISMLTSSIDKEEFN
jgi:hypothetical protein